MSASLGPIPVVRRASSWLALLALLVLGAGLFLQFLPDRAEWVYHRDKPLADLLPRSSGDWESADRPIAETPEIKKRVVEYLNYNEGLFRVYKRGTVELGVYVAYWEPGQMSQRLVAAHSPDNCWVGVGWQCEERSSEHGVAIAGRQLRQAQYRKFTQAGQTQYVWFWHLTGRELFYYRYGRRPPVTAFLEDVFERGLNQRKQQYFIRISANVPLDPLLEDPGVRQILEVLTELCLSESYAAEPGHSTSL